MKKKILVVSSYACSRSILEAQLCAERFEVIAAMSWEQAELLYSEHHPDMLVVDLEFPLDEVEAIVKRMGLSVPVLMTTYDTTTPAVDTIKAQAWVTAFLEKPYQMKVLRTTVANMARAA